MGAQVWFEKQSNEETALVLVSFPHSRAALVHSFPAASSSNRAQLSTPATLSFCCSHSSKLDPWQRSLAQTRPCSALLLCSSCALPVLSR